MELYSNAFTIVCYVGFQFTTYRELMMIQKANDCNIIDSNGVFTEILMISWSAWNKNWKL